MYLDNQDNRGCKNCPDNFLGLCGKDCQERKNIVAQAKLMEAQAALAIANAAGAPSSGGGNTGLIVALVVVVLLIGGTIAYLKLR